MFIKLAYGLQIHLFSGRLSLSAIRSHAQTVFKKLPKQYVLGYITSDGTKKTIVSEKDLAGIKCGMMKMMIFDFDDGLLSAKSDSSLGDFDDFAGLYQQQEKQLSIASDNPQDLSNNTISKSNQIMDKTLLKQENQNIKREQYIQCKSSSENQAQDNLLTSINQYFMNELIQETVDNITIEQEKMLVQESSKQYIKELQKAVLDNVILQQNQFLKQLSKNFVTNIGQTCIAQATEQEKKHYKTTEIKIEWRSQSAEESNTFHFEGCKINDFLDKLFARATQKLLAESKGIEKKPKKEKKQRMIIQSIPKRFIQKKKAKSLDLKEKPLKIKRSKSIKSMKVIQTPIQKLNLDTPQKNTTHKIERSFVSQQQLDELVDKKLRSMIPQIINKVTRIVESKMQKASCIHCEKSDLEFDQLLNRQLMRHQFDLR